MDYERIYHQLVEKAKGRGLDKKSVDYYTEIHHIVPRSVGGTDEQSNLVMFTGREHFMAHMLLYRIYPDDTSLMRAAFLMSSRWSSGNIRSAGRPIHSRTYERLREAYSEAVKIQMSENNPFKGKTHAPESIEQMKRSKRLYYRRQSLRDWRKSNDRYMSQTKLSQNSPIPHEINTDCDIPLLHVKYDLDMWLKAEAIKSYWERAGYPDAKYLGNQIYELTGKRFSVPRLRTLLKYFREGWEPSNDPSFVLTALTNYSKTINEEISSFESNSENTLSEVKEKFFKDWMGSRESHREVIRSYISEKGYEKHKNNSKAKMSIEDVVEAYILWKSGLVEQKQIAELMNVARNSISNALEAEGRWLSAREAGKELMENYFDKKNYLTLQ